MIKSNLLSRIFIFLGISIFSGIIGGFIWGLIGSFIFWVIAKASLPELYSNYSLSSLILDDALFQGIPLGLLISCATGIHHAIFGQNFPRAILWVAISGLGTASGLFLSHYTTNNFPVFLIEITLIGTMVGLITHWLIWFINKAFDSDELEITHKSLFALNLVIGFLFIFLPIYGYFRTWLMSMNTPS